MPALILALVNGQWVARFANTNISYTFVGLADPMGVKDFCNAMAQGEAVVVQEMPTFLIRPDANVTYQQMTQQLLGGTDGIVFNGRPIFSCIGDDMLVNDLDTASQALQAALDALSAA